MVATANTGKLAEMQRLLAGLGVRLLAQSSLGVTPCEEPFATFLENALVKARHASQCTGLPAIADDSGLVVDALGGDPGVRSARFYADARLQASAGVLEDEATLSVDEANWRWLLRRLQGLSGPQRAARFVSVISFVRHAHDPMPLFGYGLWAGRIAEAPAGSFGFGYDCVFFDSRMGRTAAEMLPEEKDAVSHRGDAVTRFMALYDAAYRH